jgi:uncharacterized protein DUF5753
LENGKRAANEKLAMACDRVFPERRGWFLEYYEESKSWMPPGLRSWALDLASLPNLTLQLLPPVAHPATASELIIADDAAYAEHLAAGGVYTEAETVTRLELIFTTIRAECYRASDSAAIIRKAEKLWTGASHHSAVRTGHA